MHGLTLNISKKLEQIKAHSITFVRDENDYTVHGTGILLCVKELYFIVTAAHVLDDFEKLFILLEKGKYRFKPGGKIITNKPIWNRELDDLDLGIIELDLQSVKEIKTTYSFLKEKQLLVNQQFSQNQDFMIYGFPSTWSKKSFTRSSFHIRPFFNLTSPVEKLEYHSFNRKDYLNIIVSYNRQEAINVKSKSLSYGPDLYGMSGCGLWDLSNHSKVRLLGIMTDWPIENRERIIGTRIDMVTEILRKFYDLDLIESDLFSLK